MNLPYRESRRNEFAQRWSRREPDRLAISVGIAANERMAEAGERTTELKQPNVGRRLRATAQMTMARIRFMLRNGVRELVVKSTESDKRGWLYRLILRPTGWLHRDPYGPWEKRAENIKARIQMAIGVLLVIALALRAVAGMTNFIGHPVLLAVHQHRPLELVSLGLMYAAGVELAYMLFTQGPDEAIGPVILGLSSTILLVVSDGTENWKDAVIVPVLTASVAGLFLIRERYEQQLENGKVREAKHKLCERRSEGHGDSDLVAGRTGQETATPRVSSD